MVSTRITGEGVNAPCLRRAACLILDVYDYQPTNPASKAAHLLHTARNEWDVLKTWTHRSGYKAKFYAPKGAQGDADRGKLCPPALVFRGTDDTPEDYRGVAVGLKVEYSINPGLSSIWSEHDLTRFSMPGVFDFAFSPNPETNAYGTIENLESAGFNRTNIAVSSPASFSLSLLSATMPLPSLRVDCRITAALFSKPDGDWGTNIEQGLGNRTMQYDLAMEHALYAADIAMKEWGGRLIITGHSLGGGLASAAATVAKKRFPGLKVLARTFNAAGLHRNTPMEQYQAPIGSASVNCYFVEDEILNTIQSHARSIPLVSSIFRWSRKSMPEAVTTLSSKESGEAKLWPLEKQTYIKRHRRILSGGKPTVRTSNQNFSFTQELDAIANRSSTLGQFAEELLALLLKNTLFTKVNILESKLLSKIFAESVHYHLMDAVIKTFPDKIGT